MPARPPPPDVGVPDAVAALAGDDPIVPVWENEVGGLTFAVGDGHGRRFVKWSPPDAGLDPSAEAERMRWVAPFVPVPEVLDLGADADGVWLVTAPLRGASAVTDRWTADPARAVAALAAGLRRLHDRAPVDACPFTWSARDRVASARRRAATGVTDPGRWHVEHRGLSTEGALARVATPPPVDRSVVCHGDACAPNTIVGDDGTFAGIVDLGVLGVADRWADLAIATWSTVWNFGPGWETTLLEAYGIDPDPVRTDYYRLLWDLT